MYLIAISYNASVFQVVTANDYSIDFIETGSAAWHALNEGPTSQNRNLSTLSVDEIKTTYDQEYVSTHGDVVLWVDKSSVIRVFFYRAPPTHEGKQLYSSPLSA